MNLVVRSATRGEARKLHFFITLYGTFLCRPVHISVNGHPASSTGFPKAQWGALSEESEKLHARAGDNREAREGNDGNERRATVAQSAKK